MKALYITSILILIILAPQKSLALEDCSIETRFFETSTISYQQGFRFNEPFFHSSIDANMNLVFLNFGINYNDQFGANIYTGVGILYWIQLQHGYAIENDKHLIRIRSELPLGNILGYYRHPLSQLTCGLYYEYAFKDEKRGATIGLSFGYSLWGIINKNSRG